MSRVVRALVAAMRLHRIPTGLLWVLGAAVLLAASTTVLDPALLPYVLDPEMMALLVESAVALALFSLREQVSPLFFVAGHRLMRVVARMHLVVVRHIG